MSFDSQTNGSLSVLQRNFYHSESANFNEGRGRGQIEADVSVTHWKQSCCKIYQHRKGDLVSHSNQIWLRKESTAELDQNAVEIMNPRYSLSFSGL